MMMQESLGPGTCTVEVPLQWVRNPKKEVRPLLKADKIKLLELSMNHQVREFELEENQRNWPVFVNEVVAMSVFSGCLEGATFAFVKEASGKMIGLLKSAIIARQFLAWEESTLIVLSLEEFPAAQEDAVKVVGVDLEEVVTTQLVADLSEAIRHNLTCADTCTDLLGALEQGGRELPHEMRRIHNDSVAMMGRIQEQWIAAVTKLGSLGDMDRCTTVQALSTWNWKSLSRRFCLLDTWAHVLYDRTSYLRDDVARYSRDTVVADAVSVAVDVAKKDVELQEYEKKRREERTRWTAQMVLGIQKSGMEVRSLFSEHLRWLESFATSCDVDPKDWFDVCEHLRSYDPARKLDVGEFNFLAVFSDMLGTARKNFGRLSTRLQKMMNALIEESEPCDAESFGRDLDSFVQWVSGFDRMSTEHFSNGHMSCQAHGGDRIEGSGSDRSDEMCRGLVQSS